MKCLRERSKSVSDKSKETGKKEVSSHWRGGGKLNGMGSKQNHSLTVILSVNVAL